MTEGTGGSDNETFRAYVTSTAFNLTLSKAMIKFLVRQDLIRLAGWRLDTLRRRPHRQDEPDNFIATGRALVARGLIVWTPRPYASQSPAVLRLAVKHGVEPYQIQHPKLIVTTKAGRLVLALLKEAGLYGEFARDMRLAMVEGEVA